MAECYFWMDFMKEVDTATLPMMIVSPIAPVPEPEAPGKGDLPLARRTLSSRRGRLGDFPGDEGLSRISYEDQD